MLNSIWSCYIIFVSFFTFIWIVKIFFNEYLFSAKNIQNCKVEIDIDSDMWLMVVHLVCRKCDFYVNHMNLLYKARHTRSNWLQRKYLLLEHIHNVTTCNATDRHALIAEKINDVKHVFMGSFTCNLQLPGIHAATTCNATGHRRIYLTLSDICNWLPYTLQLTAMRRRIAVSCYVNAGNIFSKDN